jgi:ribose/xylose/arabinose/galactoside ABC-type transport system permease subunit
VAYVGIPSFIATLGMMSACQGIARLVSQAKSIAPLPDEISVLGRGYVMGIPVSVVIMLALYVILSFVARKTILGRYIYSIGGSKEAAFFSGINVKKYSMMTFVISGFLAGLGSVVLLSRLGAASVTNGKAYEFDAIIGCVLGGVSMAGGKGKLIQVLFGVLFLTIFFNGMTQLNVNPFLQDVLKGVVLVLAVTIDVMRNKLRN